jgi:hypothetical protein
MVLLDPRTADETERDLVRALVVLSIVFLVVRRWL